MYVNILGYTMYIHDIGYTMYIHGYTMYIPDILVTFQYVCQWDQYVWDIHGIYQAYTENRGSRCMLSRMHVQPSTPSELEVRTANIKTTVQGKKR
jgi:hypothetical protein